MRIAPGWDTNPARADRLAGAARSLREKGAASKEVATALLGGASHQKSAIKTASSLAKVLEDASAAGIGEPAATAKRRAARALIGSPAFDRFRKAPQGRFPVGVLDDEVRGWLHASRSVAGIPARRMQHVNRKHIRRRKDLRRDDLLRLPDVIGEPVWVVSRSGMPGLHLMLPAGRDTYHAAVRRGNKTAGPNVWAYYRSRGPEYRQIVIATAEKILRRPAEE